MAMPGRWWSLYRLGRQPHPLAGPLARVLGSASRPPSAPEEQAWVARIERLRAELQASTDPVAWLDHGAGTPESNRTPAAMHAGVEVTQPLGEVCTIASKSPFWCSVLFRIVRALRPRACVEMGTAVGISAAYQAAALTLNGLGTLTTLEGGAALADVARDTLRRLGLDTATVVAGRFADTLGEILRSRGPVDYVFVDGHHDGEATLAYFEQMVPCLAPTAVVILDDIAWSRSMRAAWRTLVEDERVRLAVDLGPLGLCVVDDSIARRRVFRIPLP
jgi:predicted O-methyltransferase YrrM